MNGTTILLWITILIIGTIAIITVKLHYKGDELEKDEKSILPTETIGGVISYGRDKISNVNNTPQDNPTTEKIDNDYNVYTMDELEEEPIENTSKNQVLTNYENKIEKETNENKSENQVLINYENNVEQFQKPTNEDQIDNMTPNNDQNNEKSELKDLFTIDELIKESKRKDSEREKEAQQINNDEEDEELEEIKESIRKRKENDDEIEEQLIEEILADEDIEKLLAEDEPVDEIVEVEESKEETIQDIIDNSEPQEETISEEIKEEPITPEEPQEETIQDVLDVEETAPSEIETPVATQKDIEEAINTASQEIEEEKVEEISDSENITDALLNSQEEVEEEIKQPTLKTPTKIDKTKKEDEIGAPIDDSNLINETEEENDLDYRKDINKITNKIKGSRLFKDVRDKLIPEPEPEVDPIADLEESYIRNVNEYEDEYAPIINETHDYFGSELGETYEPDYDEAIRQENTRRLFGDTQQSPEPEIAEPKKEIIKSKPARDNIKIQLNNTEVVLKKGDEIIYRHDGETYSSQVYAINGDEISVKYRRQNIIIKPEDVKKIY